MPALLIPMHQVPNSLVVFFASIVGLVAPLHGQSLVDGARQTTPSRIIDIDFSAVKGPRSMVYQYCVGAGRVAEGLRADWQAQLKTCKDAIGFQSLRCHGLLHDELGVYREDKQGNTIYNWQYIDMVYDYHAFHPCATVRGDRIHARCSGQY